MSDYDRGFARAQAAYDNATPEDHWGYEFDEDDDGPQDEPDPDDERDRRLDAQEVE